MNLVLFYFLSLLFFIFIMDFIFILDLGKGVYCDIMCDEGMISVTVTLLCNTIEGH